MNTALLSLALAALAGTSPAPESFGGWASISVEKVPDQVVTGKAFELVFVVKQHGKTPLSGRKPTLEIKGEAHEFELSQIERARLVPDFERKQELKR